jgi:hypothetical protein
VGQQIHSKIQQMPVIKKQRIILKAKIQSPPGITNIPNPAPAASKNVRPYKVRTEP